MGRNALYLASVLALAGCHLAPWSSGPSAPARKLGADYPLRAINHQLLVGAGGSAVSSVSPGTVGQFLTSGGPGADPSWGAVAYSSLTGAPTSLPPNGAAGGDLALSYPNPQVAGLLSHALPSLPGSDLYLHFNGSAWAFSALPTSLPPNGTAGGDLSGSYPNPTVAGILSKALPSLPGSDMYLHYTGSAWQFSTLGGGGGGVTSLTGGSGIGVSAATGAVTLTNTGVVSLTASTGISLSGSTGSIIVTNTAPAPSNSVANGLTGITTCAAGDFVQGNGTSPLQCTFINPNRLLLSGGTGVLTGVPNIGGLALVGNGSLVAPSFQVVPVTGGGTGLTSVTPGALLVGNNTSALNVVSNVTGAGFGGVLESTGSGVGWTVIQRPSTQSTSGALSYGTPIGAPTVWSQLASFPITIPAGGANIAVHMDFQWDMPPLTAIICGGTCLPCYELVVFGIGVDSPTVATVTSLATPPTAYSPSPVDSNGSNSLNYGAFLSAGSHNIYSLSKIQNGNCAINVWSDAVLDVFP